MVIFVVENNLSPLVFRMSAVDTQIRRERELIIAGMKTPQKMNRNPKSTITIDKSPQPILKQIISQGNKKGALAAFPPIAEGIIQQTPPSYPVSPKMAGDSTKEPAPSLSTMIAGRKMPSSTNACVANTALKGMGRFSTILKAKLAFKTKKKPKVDDSNNDNDDDIDEKDAEVELPKEPRFSTTMSTEAQYAMLKGYEDTVYDCLYKEYPECRQKLKRNKTPLHKVDIVVDGKNNICDNNASCNKNQDSNEEPLVDGSTMCSPESADGVVSVPSAPRALRRASVPCTSISKPKILTRINSLPNMIPRQKQLVISYRLQSAMDILDTVRNGLGFNYTSPRVKASVKPIRPVKDYNRWSSVWGKEFNVLVQDSIRK